MSAIVIAENDFNETYLVALLDAIFGDDEGDVPVDVEKLR